jgi:hypothetical protein
VACPYFMPVTKLENGAWPHSARLPLGGGWSGYCTAPGHDAETPSQQVLENCCNLGYANGCGWIPRDRAWDAVRFGVMAPATAETLRGNGLDQPASEIRLRYVCERNHLPAADGELQFNLARSAWSRRNDDPRLQKMAECFLEAYLSRKSPAKCSQEEQVFARGERNDQ